jgi:hypothetical protein
VGEKRSAGDEARAAREAWQRGLDLGVVEFVEYASAR